jgi:periplasmic protein TonB
MEELLIEMPVDYGYAEVKKIRKKYHYRAMAIAATILGLAVAGYQISEWLSREAEPTIMVRSRKYSELGPPPSMTQEAPAVAVSGPAVKPTIGLPVPVPDAEVSPEQTIATQKELANIQGPVAEQGNATGQIEKDLKIEQEDLSKLNLNQEPPDFVAYEKEPLPVKQIQPKYPDLAIKAGLEGTVVLKVWVTKEGKVKKAVILKSDADVFNEAAIEAAKQWVFTPALQQKKPIDVWVSIPFKFRLKDATGN